MRPEISERSFEGAIDCRLLQYGSNPCGGDSTEIHETPIPFGEMPKVGYHKSLPQEYNLTRFSGWMQSGDKGSISRRIRLLGIER